MSQTLGRPLVVHVSEATCDKAPQHALRVVTDGTTFYAADVTESEQAVRAGHTLRITCGQPTPHDGDPCVGEAVVDFATEGWVASQCDIDLLLTHGERVSL